MSRKRNENQLGLFDAPAPMPKVARVRDKEKARESVRKYRAKNPEKVRESARKYRAKNPEKHRERDRKWRSDNPDKARKWAAANPERRREIQHRARRRSDIKKYGITLGKFDAMRQSPCACGGVFCQCPFDVRNRTGKTCRTCGLLNPHVDHCHACEKAHGGLTGEGVRGLLCTVCNTSLGHLEKYGVAHASPVFAAYLARHVCVTVSPSEADK